MRFNGAQMVSLNDLQPVRYLTRTDYQYTYIARFVPKQQFVFVREQLEFGKRRPDNTVPRLLLHMGENEHVVRYLGYCSLDGRSYLLLQYYPLNSLQTQLGRYRRCGCKFTEQTIWNFLNQLLRGTVALVKAGLQPHLNPAWIMLEERVEH